MEREYRRPRLVIEEVRRKYKISQYNRSQM